VTAVLVGAAGPPGEVAATVEVPSLAEVRDAALAAGTELVWVLGEGTQPLPDTLQGLLDAAHEPAASLPVDAAGEPVESAVGRFVEHDPAVLLREALERRVPLRHAPVTSLLLRRETVEDAAPPDPGRFGAYAGDEWTGRLFARSQGMLVPASRVRYEAPGGGSARHVLRTARAGGWGRGETLRELYRSVTE
jgi:hypothetical protein